MTEIAPGGGEAERDLLDRASQVIEEGQAGSFVYKTIDRRTGEVVLQLPREEVLRMRDAEAYVAGAVIATQA